MLHPEVVQCPYCGESFDTSVDLSAGDQEYIEDCYVCCRPIVFQLSVSGDGSGSRLVVRRDDE